MGGGLANFTVEIAELQIQRVELIEERIQFIRLALLFRCNGFEGRSRWVEINRRSSCQNLLLVSLAGGCLCGILVPFRCSKQF